MLMCFSPSPLPLDFDPHFSHIYYPSHFTLPPCLQRTLSLLILHISPFISTTPLSLYPRSPSRFYIQTTSSRLKQRGPPNQGKFPLNFPLLLGIKTEIPSLSYRLIHHISVQHQLHNFPNPKMGFLSLSTHLLVCFLLIFPHLRPNPYRYIEYYPRLYNFIANNVSRYPQTLHVYYFLHIYQ